MATKTKSSKPAAKPSATPAPTTITITLTITITPGSNATTNVAVGDQRMRISGEGDNRPR